MVLIMTIYDIAKEAGVSASTVSRVITGSAKVKQETKDRVNAILQKHNFVPDQNARVLVSGASKLIGIVIEDIRIDHHTSIAYFIESKLREIGYCGIILNSGSQLNHINSCINILVKRKVEAIILVGSRYQDEEVLKSIQKNFPKGPALLLNGHSQMDNMWSIVIDEEDGVRQCVEKLYSIGKRNIAYIQKPTTASGQRKKNGYIGKMLELGYTEENLLIVDSSPNIEDGYLNTMKALYHDKNIDGIIYSEDIIAVGGIKALLSVGKSIPDDVAVISINNSIYCDIVSPRLTSLNTAMEELSTVSVKLLQDVLQGNNPDKTTTIKLDIVLRETT